MKTKKQKTKKQKPKTLLKKALLDRAKKDGKEDLLKAMLKSGKLVIL